MNTGGESSNDTVVDLPSDLESTPGFVSESAEEAPSGVQDEGASATPSDQTSVRRF